MHNQPRKRSSWFVTLPIAIGGIGYLWFVFFPTARAIREIRSEIREKEEFVAQCESLHRTVVQMEVGLTETRQYTQQWRRQTPVAGQLSNLFGKITDQVRQAGVTATRFEPQQEIVLETVERVPVHIELSGSCLDVFQLLAALERLPEAIWVEELKLEKSSEAGKNVKGELKLEVFAANLRKSG